MRRILALLLLLSSAGLVRAQNVVVNLLTPLEATVAGADVRVDLVILNPTSAEVAFETPLTLTARLTRGQKSWPVELRGQAGGGAMIAARGFSYRAFVFTVPADARGRMALELDKPLPARAVLDVRSVEAATEEEKQRAAEVVSAPLSNVLPNQPASSAIQRTFAGRFMPHEPVYFIYGPDKPAVKFQFSFKYRLLGDAGALGQNMPALRGLYLGFSQRSLWDIHAASSPFYDTSYMPELILESQQVVDSGSAGGLQLLGFQGAFKHESNGKGGADSRSLNIAYVRAGVAFGKLDGWHLIVAPRVFAYVGDLSDNPDIRTYRGNADLVAVFGRNDGPALALSSRLARRGAVEANLTFPLKSDKLFDFATYFLIQYWDGYGESLLDYNKHSRRIRAGVSLVR